MARVKNPQRFSGKSGRIQENYPGISIAGLHSQRICDKVKNKYELM
jgi:hypothetical protein